MLKKKQKRAQFLYRNLSDPHTLRVLITLAYTQVPCDTHLIIHAQSLERLGFADTSFEHLPILLVAKDTMRSSTEMMDWALDAHDPERWTEWDLDEADETQMLMEWCDNFFIPRLQALQNSLSQDERSALIEDASVFITSLNDLLQHSDYCLRDEATLIDIALWPAISQWRELTSQALPSPMNHWHQRLSEHSAIQQALAT